MCCAAIWRIGNGGVSGFFLPFSHTAKYWEDGDSVQEVV
jgi:hypothetical protein